MTAESLAKARITVIDGNAKEEPTQLAKAG
jgi:hypothetical protein